MGQQVSISIAKGKGSIAHNNRDFIANNVDRNRMQDNIVFVQIPLEEAYKQCFTDSIEDYNSRQKRKDRRIDGVKGYMDKLEASKNGEKLYYENIIQIGNLLDSSVGSASGEVCVDVLKKYMADFKKRNPNLYVFNAVLHLDEKTPHLHIDYIPVAKGYKQGLKVRNSLDKALKMQGIDGEANKYANSTIQWQKREKDYLEELMKPYGLERKEESGLSRKHLSVEQYKAVAEIAKNEYNSIPDVPMEITQSLFSDSVKVNPEDIARLQERAKLSKLHEESLQKVLDTKNTILESASASAERMKENARSSEREADRKLESAKREASSIVDTANDYKAYMEDELKSAALTNREAEEWEKRAYDRWEAYDEMYKEQVELTERYEKLKEDYDSKSAFCDRLEYENKNLQKKNKTLESRLQSVCTTLMDVIKALSCFRFGKDSYKDYRMSMNEYQSALMEAMEETAVSSLFSVGQDDMVKEIKAHYGISKDIRQRENDIYIERREAEEELRRQKEWEYGYDR